MAHSGVVFEGGAYNRRFTSTEESVHNHASFARFHTSEQNGCRCRRSVAYLGTRKSELGMTSFLSYRVRKKQSLWCLTVLSDVYFPVQSVLRIKHMNMSVC